MKRIIIIGTSIILLSAFACSKPVEDAGSSAAPAIEPAAAAALQNGMLNTVEPAIEQSEDSWQCSDPPEQIIFRSSDDYLALAEAIEFEDSAFDEFLDKNGFCLNGVHTKSDAKKVLAAIDSMPVPYIESFEFDYSELCFDTNHFYILYRSRTDKDYYLAFKMFLTSSDAATERKANEASGEPIDIKSDSEFKYLVRATEKSASDPNSSYVTNVRSHQVTLITNIPENELLNALNICQFTTMSEYAKKAAP